MLKTLTTGIILIFWMLLTLILAITIIGLVVVVEDKWFDIGKLLTKKIIEL